MQRTLKNYQLIDLIGEGNFSSVYKAIHNESQKVYAIKCLKKLDLNVLKDLSRMKPVSEIKSKCYKLMFIPMSLNLFNSFKLTENGILFWNTVVKEISYLI